MPTRTWSSRWRGILEAGFTGKNREGAMRHVEELKAHGVAAPDRIPAYYAVPREMATTDDEIEVLGDTTSGEVEVVFLFKGDHDLYRGGQ